jgi:hypothetical protein
MEYPLIKSTHMRTVDLVKKIMFSFLQSVKDHVETRRAQFALGPEGNPSYTIGATAGKQAQPSSPPPTIPQTNKKYLITRPPALANCRANRSARSSGIPASSPLLLPPRETEPSQKSFPPARRSCARRDILAVQPRAPAP